MPIVYDELHRLAQRYMRGEGDAGTLQATALVNEAYMRMVDVRRMRWQNRAHFFAVAAILMRRILVDAARSRLAKKRGDGGELVPIDESMALQDAPVADVLAIDDALGRLSAVDPRKARVVELRFFADLTIAETGGGAAHIGGDRDARLENGQELVGARAARVNGNGCRALGGSRAALPRGAGAARRRRTRSLPGPGVRQRGGVAR
jgi:RNA polymerase sigma factor (TIGR02999 family)